MFSSLVLAIIISSTSQALGYTSCNLTTARTTPNVATATSTGVISSMRPTISILQSKNGTGWSHMSQGPTASVTVGAKGELAFSPQSVQAAIGTMIFFDFLALNHTLTQSELLHPCQSNGGFDTGFHQFNPKNISGRFVVEYRVEHLNPQWFFCSQTFQKNHCNAGMVFSINPGGSKDQFLKNALAAVTETDPAQTSVSACQLPKFGLLNNTATITAGPTMPATTTTASNWHISVSSTRIFPPITLVNSGGSIHVNAMLIALGLLVL